jgi:MerR family transcriptional regulator, redox-sensitive transcriptional activator SoxR
MARLSIGEVARRAEIETSTIRYYEAIGLLPEPERESGRRVYDEAVLSRLAVIQEAKRTGFTLREIHRLLNGFPAGTPAGERWRSLSTGKVAQIERQIAELESMRERIDRTIACECRDLTECANELNDPCRSA